LIQQPELASDARFATNPARVVHRYALIAQLDAVFVKRTAENWVELLLDAGIPAGPIHTVAQALNTPNTASRGLIHEVELQTGDLIKLVGSPLKLSATPATVRTAPPTLGQHTADVLTELLGYDAARINELHESNII
jgi:crotonobetainyl-CoA:carnitine CoA-transferase CaiB-like acyl-CoA transferase